MIYTYKFVLICINLYQFYKNQFYKERVYYFV